MYYLTKPIAGGREAAFFPITFGRARLAIGLANDFSYQDVW